MVVPCLAFPPVKVLSVKETQHSCSPIQGPVLEGFLLHWGQFGIFPDHLGHFLENEPLLMPPL